MRGTLVSRKSWIIMQSSSYDELVEQWHLGEGEGLTLREYLGMDEDEYLDFILGRLEE
jgi:hypothetical protein